MIKRLFIQFIQFLFSNERIFIKFKDTALCNPSEHLIRAVNFIHSSGKNIPDSKIIDIGAANGATAFYFHHHFPQSRIIAFEPIPFMYHLAIEKCKHISAIEIRNIALSDQNGKATFNVTANFLSSSLNDLNQEALATQPAEHLQKFKQSETLEVMTRTLNDEMKDAGQILLIKLDTQGTELNILKGGSDVLKRTEFVLAEMNNHHLYKNTCQYHEVDEYLRLQGFRLIDIVVTYRDQKGRVPEYDALYQNGHT